MIEESNILNRKITEVTTGLVLDTGSVTGTNKRSRKGQRADALALEGEEGRDKLRKAPGRCK